MAPVLSLHRFPKSFFPMAGPGGGPPRRGRCWCLGARTFPFFPLWIATDGFLAATPSLERDAKPGKLSFVHVMWPRGSLVLIHFSASADISGGDENFPQCRNCYQAQDSLPVQWTCLFPMTDLPARTSQTSCGHHEIEAQVRQWQQTGVFPFPSLNIYPDPLPQFLSFEDLRLLHHVASIGLQLGSIDRQWVHALD